MDLIVHTLDLRACSFRLRVKKRKFCVQILNMKLFGVYMISVFVLAIRIGILAGTDAVPP